MPYLFAENVVIATTLAVHREWDAVVAQQSAMTGTKTAACRSATRPLHSCDAALGHGERLLELREGDPALPIVSSSIISPVYGTYDCACKCGPNFPRVL